MTRVLRSGLLSLIVAGLLVGEALAQGYPAKPIRVIIGFPPGGAPDIMARLIAPKFQESQGQPWVIDNRPGAQGTIGTHAAARAAPDGYTLLMITGSNTVHPSTYTNLPFDIRKDFAPVTQTSNTVIVLVVHPSVPARSVKDFIALAKSQPGRLNFASDGPGSIVQLAAELFKSMAGVDMTDVPYKGGAPGVAATVAGEVDLMFATMPSVAAHIRSGRVRALGVCTTKRVTAMPELPTIAEAGLPGYEATNATGVVAPAGTPREIISKLHQEITRILAIPEIEEQLRKLGAERVGSTPDEFGAYIRGEVAKWTKVVKAIGLKPQTF